jgi:hypothetical protein
MKSFDPILHGIHRAKLSGLILITMGRSESHDPPVLL